MSHSKAIPHLLARDRQIPAFHGKIGARTGDLAIPFEQKQPVCVKCDIVNVVRSKEIQVNSGAPGLDLPT